MKNEVMAYKCPESTKIKYFNTLLIGQISAGKSSIINTMVSAFNEDDEVAKSAQAGAAGESLTKHVSCMSSVTKSLK
jgi:predicted GTPase